MDKIFIAVLAIILIPSCTTENGKRYIVTEQLSVYKSPIDGTNDVLFVLNKGEECKITEEQANKVYLFKRVNCSGRIGWTPDWYRFKEKQ